MNNSIRWVDQMKIGMVIGLLTALTGCAGFWGGGYYNEGYYGQEVVVPEPDAYLFGVDYYSGRDARNYSHRGSESRRAVHTGVSHEAAHSSGGRGGKR